MRGALLVAGACRFRGPLRCRAWDALRAREVITETEAAGTGSDSVAASVASSVAGSDSVASSVTDSGSVAKGGAPGDVL